MTYDGDSFTELFAELAELTLDPFAPPLAGHNALRAYLLEAAEAERHYDLAMSVTGSPGTPRSPPGMQAGTAPPTSEGPAGGLPLRRGGARTGASRA